MSTATYHAGHLVVDDSNGLSGIIDGVTSTAVTLLSTLYRMDILSTRRTGGARLMMPREPAV